MRHYIPDFLVKAKNGSYLVEGWHAQTTAEAKAAAAKAWGEKVTELTGETWNFVKILEGDFERFRSLPFGTLVQAAASEDRG